MLKINLLPPYIYEGKTRKVWVAVWILAVVAVVGGMLFWQSKINAETADWNQKRDSENGNATLADSLKADATRIDAESAGIRSKNDFVKLAQQHNRTAYPDVYRNVAEYTMNGIVYSGISPAQGQVNINAVAPSLNHVARYVMWMEHNPKIMNVNIGIASVPGFPDQGQAQAGGNQASADGGPPASWHPFTVALTLAQPIPGAPSFGGGGGGGGGGEAGGGGGGATPAPSPAAGGGGKRLPGA